MTTKKKIAILGTAYPFRGGLAAYNERIARAYQERGDMVTIYTFTTQYPSIFFPGKSQFSDSTPPKKLNIQRIVNSVRPLSWLLVGNKIRKEKPDILIIKYWLPFKAPCFGTIAQIVKRNHHTKVISILDNIIPHEARIGDKLFSRYFVKAVDGFVAMSKSVFNDIDFFDKKKPRTLSPHPLYDHFGDRKEKAIARKLLDINVDGKYILFFGFIRDYKGLDLLLEAMADKRIIDSGIKLIVAGEFYSDSQKYFSLIEKLKISENVLMHNDFIPDEKVGDYFCAADIIVQPYKTATQSGVTQIGYHFEKPMIVTDVGGLAEIIPDNKVGFVTQVSPQAITEAILRFYNEKKEESFLSNIKEEKKKYSWTTMLNAVDEIEKEIR